MISSPTTVRTSACRRCWSAFNKVEGGSVMLAELVMVVHAACTYFDTVVGQGPLELAKRALGLQLRNPTHGNSIWIGYMQEGSFRVASTFYEKTDKKGRVRGKATDKPFFTRLSTKPGFYRVRELYYGLGSVTENVETEREFLAVLSWGQRNMVKCLHKEGKVMKRLKESDLVRDSTQEICQLEFDIYSFCSSFAVYLCQAGDGLLVDDHLGSKSDHHPHSRWVLMENSHLRVSIYTSVPTLGYKKIDARHLLPQQGDCCDDKGIKFQKAGSVLGDWVSISPLGVLIGPSGISIGPIIKVETTVKEEEKIKRIYRFFKSLVFLYGLVDRLVGL
ncbi:hypothetical protein LguiA_002553 [Lonicera macranthoides]